MRILLIVGTDIWLKCNIPFYISNVNSKQKVMPLHLSNFNNIEISTSWPYNVTVSNFWKKGHYDLNDVENLNLRYNFITYQLSVWHGRIPLTSSDEFCLFVFIPENRKICFYDCLYWISVKLFWMISIFLTLFFINVKRIQFLWVQENTYIYLKWLIKKLCHLLKVFQNIWNCSNLVSNQGF